ncbi:MAG: substrate-binding domain-containing protein [Propionibacteriaceae bacterium]|nr:substrate-binding domain-containing protein [Propionibacteriaceae bacterium]
MKKALSLVSLTLMAVLGLSACGTGGDSGFDTTKNITVTAREDGSGTKSAFMEIIGLKGQPDPAGVIIQNSTAGVLTEVSGNPTAIAYESLGYVTDQVKMLKVDGVDATIDNIKNDTYKIARPLSVVYKEATVADATNKAFLTFLESADAQEIISSEGYVSIVDGAAAYTIEADLAGTINISGSTSLKPLMDVLAKKFADLQPNVTVNVGGGGSGQGYSDAQDGVTEFGMISEHFNAEKAPDATSYTVCKDGIAVIVNPVNPLDSISMDQLKSIYDAEAGDTAITTWDSLIQ